MDKFYSTTIEHIKNYRMKDQFNLYIHINGTGKATTLTASVDNQDLKGS